jgi:hypothetical protein
VSATRKLSIGLGVVLHTCKTPALRRQRQKDNLGYIARLYLRKNQKEKK